MPLTPAAQLLKDVVEAMPLFDGRFEKPVLVNLDSATNEKRGTFSLVFKAFDQQGQKLVALKFFDPGPVLDPYRAISFQREHQILDHLRGAARCLQVESPFTTFTFNANLANGTTLPVSFNYFAVEWIEDDLDKYFLDQNDDVLAKLQIFRGVVLAVVALHSREVFHRDLKADNLRRRRGNKVPEIVAIDLGTAARHSSNTAVAAPYPGPAGFMKYSAPEAWCGYASDRSIAGYTDVYALGALLFEMFNTSEFDKALLAKNPQWQMHIAALQAEVTNHAKPHSLEALHDALKIHGRSIDHVDVEGTGTEIPDGLTGLIAPLIIEATKTDYRQRPSLAKFLKKLRSAEISVRNEELTRKRLARRKLYRENRRANIAAREAKLAARRSSS